VIIGLVALLTLILTAFAWPAVNTAPRDVPIVVTGLPSFVEQVRGTLDQAHPGAFEITVVDDLTKAKEAIRSREAYGAVASGASGPRVLVASAASPTVAQALTQVSAALAAGQEGETVEPPEDVVPTPADDPRGAGLGIGALPVALAGVLCGAVLALGVVGLGRRLLAGLLVAGLAGLAFVGVLDLWLGVLQGDLLLELAVAAGGLAATIIAMIGLGGLLGRPGLALGAGTIILLGIPLSGATSAPEMLPEYWSELGQALPPGAVLSLLRSVSFFDAAKWQQPTIVLGAWALGGLVLILLAALFARRRAGR